MDDSTERHASKPDVSFKEELKSLLNRNSMENASNTPDFILAQYMDSCLDAFVTATQQRETWYGRDARPYHDTLEENPDGSIECWENDEVLPKRIPRKEKRQ